MHDVEVSLADLDSLDCRMVHAYRAPVLYQHSHLRHRVPWCVVWLIEHGSVDFLEDSDVHHVYRAGEWVFQMPDAQVNRAFSKDASIISIRFYARWPNGRPLFGEANYKAMHDKQLPGLKAAALKYLEVVPWVKNKQYHLHAYKLKVPINQFWDIHTARSAFLGQWYKAAIKMGFKEQAPYTTDARVDQALRFIAEAKQEGNVPYQEICQTLSISRAHLDRLFQKYIGHSPKAEHDRIRIEHALDRIRDHQIPIKKIAFELGFQDASQFARWFKRLLGQNPNAARSQREDA